MYCDQTGCHGYRRVIADASGNWIADFAHVGEDSDEQDIFDFGPGAGSEAAQGDEDGDETRVRWHLSDPRIQVSYEHDWIQIYDFTPGGDVTYTIYDYQGGHALCGPVTAPVDSHGDGWVDSSLHHIDLIPGNFITAVDVASGEEASILIRELNLDYVGVDDDRVFGTAEPNTTIQLYINETHDQGFNLTVEVDSAGYWEVNLAAQGHPIDGYRHAGASLYDAEGDSIHAQPPRIHAQISTDSFSVDNFSKNGDVTLTLYDSRGGTILYGPVTLQTDSQGNTWVDLWDLGIDLVPGNTIVAYDHTLDFTKSLEVESFDFVEMNAADDYVTGTATVGEWVNLHVTSLFSNWGLVALTAENGEWFRDYGAENYDITDQMWANGWAADDQGNQSEDHTTGLPGLEVSVAEDWISGYNFSPDRQVRIRIYAPEGGSLLLATSGDPLADFLVTARGDTHFYADYWQHGVDLQPGMYILAEDLETGKASAVTLVHLTFDGVDYDADAAWGTAEPDTQVLVRANHIFDHYEISVMADEAGNWSANFAAQGADLTPEWDLQAMVFDLELDTTVANAPRPPVFTASLDDDWLNGNHWTPNDSVSIHIYEYESGPVIGSVFTSDTDLYGNFNADLWSEDIDLLPGNFITVTDNFNGVTKALTLPELTIDTLDPDLDLAGGRAPADTRLSLDFYNQQESVQFDLFSSSDGTWEVNFADYDFNLQQGSGGSVMIHDEDGDAVQVDRYVPNPTIGARANSDQVEGWEWPLGATVNLTINDPETPGETDYTASATVGTPDWNPNQTWFNIELAEEYDLKAGDIVTATDGTTTKELVVADFEITDVDVDTDTVYGFADPGQSVNVWTCWQDEPCINREVTADQEGNWSENFGVPGNQDWEQQTADLQPGSWMDSSVSDEDGDSTMFGMNVLSYTLHAVPAYPEVHGHDWPQGADITLIIDDDTDPDNGVLYNLTKNADDDPWCGYPCFDLAGVFELQAGQYVTMTDGSVTKTVRVSALQILEVNHVGDTLSGMADPGSDVMVNIASQEDLARHVVAAADGSWTVDFSVVGDEDFEQFTADIGYGDYGRAIQRNPDGTDDGTLEYWNVDWVAPEWIPLVAPLGYSPDLNRLGYDTDTWNVGNLLWQPLFRYTSEDMLIPAAATGYVLSPDGLTYTIPLRDDIYWSDGQPVTAQHFVDGFLRILAPDTATDYASLLYDIQGAREYNEGTTSDPNDVGLTALDDHTLRITLAHPAVHIPQVLAVPGMIPARLDLIDLSGDAWTDPSNFVGNGPYLLIEKDNGHILLQKNPNYYDAANLAFEHIAFDVIADMNEQFNAYQRGEVDVVIDASQDAISDPNYESEHFAAPFPGVMHIGLNVQDSPTDNLLIRKALAASINRRYLLDNILNTPWANEATGVIPPELPGYQGAEVGYTYDPASAQNWLVEAGYPGGAGLPTIDLYGRSSNEALLEAIADQWRAVLGVSVEVHLVDNVGEYLHQCQESPICSYNAYRAGWIVDYFDAHSLLNDYFHPDSWWQLSGWDSAQYRELISLSMAEQDPAQRIAYLQEAERILVEGDVVTIPLYFTYRISLIKPGFDPVYGLIPYFDLWNYTTPNQPPQISSITAPVDPIQVGQTITATATFNDPDVGDTHTALWNWGDGTSTTLPASPTTVTAFHTYAVPGVYTVSVTITDAAGESDSASFQYIVIYDPSGGFVTGGGWFIDPQTGAKAHFGFNPKYHKDSTLKGETEFKLDGLKFKSTSHDWLVINGAKATFTGMGTMNGSGEYIFIVTVIDGSLAGGGSDKIRMLIWNDLTGEVVYDNEPGAAEYADSSTSIGGGSIVIHKAK